jgi:hypothetical protein
MSKFNLNEMLDASVQAINEFSALHPNETFYSFGIDSNMLCANSIECFETTLKKYQEKFPKSHNTLKEINELKMNTGDWEYQDFYSLTEEDGFNDDSYDSHYYKNSFFQKFSSYSIMMRLLLWKIKLSGAFDQLNKTKDFKIIRPEHNY